jgi:hypothetical protein
VCIDFIIQGSSKYHQTSVCSFSHFHQPLLSLQPNAPRRLFHGLVWEFVEAGRFRSLDACQFALSFKQRQCYRLYTLPHPSSSCPLQLYWLVPDVNISRGYTPAKPRALKNSSFPRKEVHFDRIPRGQPELAGILRTYIPPSIFQGGFGRGVIMEFSHPESLPRSFLGGRWYICCYMGIWGPTFSFTKIWRPNASWVETP